MKPLLPYMGAKGSVVDQIEAAFAPEAKQCYIEMFVGGGSIYLNTPPARRSILNDCDFDVMDVYEAVAGHPEEVMDAMKRLPIARQVYERIRQQRGTADWSALDLAERAARTIYLYECAFNGNPRSTFPASVMTPLRFDPNRDLRPFSKHLAGTTLECLDWAELLTRYVVNPKRVRCQIVADPPYLAAIRGEHYRHRFGYLDHVMLARMLTQIHRCNGGERSVKILVTLDEHPFVRALYREEFGWHLEPLEIRYGGGHHSHATSELLITNYKIGEKS